MSPSKLLTLIVAWTAFSGLGCDRVSDLKNRVFGSGAADVGGDAAVEAMREAHASGQCAQVLQQAAALLAERADSVDALYYQGRCLLDRAGEPDDSTGPLGADEEAALTAFQRAMSLNPRHAPSSIGVGDLYRRRVRGVTPDDPESAYALARAAYERAVAIDPGLPEAHSRLGEFLTATGDLEGADQAYRSAAEAAATVPELAPDYYLAYGRFLAGPADRLDEAVDQFELARMFRQDDPSIQKELALAQARIGLRHFERQEFLLAQTALEEAVGMFPDTSIPEARPAVETLERLRSMRRR